MPQAHGINAGEVRRSQLIPRGMGMPMTKPKGARNAIASKAFNGVVSANESIEEEGQQRKIGQRQSGDEKADHGNVPP